MERNIISGGRHGDKLWRQCCSSRWERTALDQQKTGLLAALSVPTLPAAVLLLLGLLFVTVVAVSPGCNSGAPTGI